MRLSSWRTSHRRAPSFWRVFRGWEGSWGIRLSWTILWTSLRRRTNRKMMILSDRYTIVDASNVAYHIHIAYQILQAQNTLMITVYSTDYHSFITIRWKNRYVRSHGDTTSSHPPQTTSGTPPRVRHARSTCTIWPTVFPNFPRKLHIIGCTCTTPSTPIICMTRRSRCTWCPLRLSACIFLSLLAE